MFDLNEIVNDIRDIHNQELEKRRNKMMTENEIRNQYEIAKTLHEQGKWNGKIEHQYELEEKWEALGYILALKYVLGLEKPKFDKEDI